MSYRQRGEHHKVLFRAALDQYREAIQSGDTHAEARMREGILRSFDGEVDTASNLLEGVQ